MGNPIDYVVAIGPIPMMWSVSTVTKIPENPIKTIVSLNPVMLDGTGMCGGCRASVGGKNVFVCVDGPEFDAHEVDFDTLSKRSQTYKTQEHSSMCIYNDKCIYNTLINRALKPENHQQTHPVN
jgi:ferredoxin--NADP+ reductase